MAVNFSKINLNRIANTMHKTRWQGPLLHLRDKVLSPMKDRKVPVAPEAQKMALKLFRKINTLIPTLPAEKPKIETIVPPTIETMDTISVDEIDLSACRPKEQYVRYSAKQSPPLMDTTKKSVKKYLQEKKIGWKKIESVYLGPGICDWDIVPKQNIKINVIAYKAKAFVRIGLDGKVRVGVLAEDQEIQGVKCAEDSIVGFHEFGLLRGGAILAEDQKIQGINFPKNTHLSFTTEGRLMAAGLKIGQEFMGEKISKEIWLLFNEEEDINEAGRLISAKTKNDLEIGGEQYPAGTRILFDEQGRVSRAEEPPTAELIKPEKEVDVFPEFGPAQRGT